MPRWRVKFTIETPDVPLRDILDILNFTLFDVSFEKSVDSIERITDEKKTRAE